MDPDRYNAELEAKVAAEMRAERMHTSGLYESEMRAQRTAQVLHSGNRKQRRAAKARAR